MKIELKNMKHVYPTGDEALKGINLVIEGTEPVAIIGQNGAGKTTIVKHFNGILRPTSGEVLINGEDINNRSTAKWSKEVGYVFQNPDLQILEDTVFDEVAYGPKAKKLTAETIKKQVEAALAATGLAELAGAYPRLLSFGQKRRLGVASALALNPRTLILDEITNGQDAIEKERMMQYL